MYQLCVQIPFNNEFKLPLTGRLNYRFNTNHHGYITTLWNKINLFSPLFSKEGRSNQTWGLYMILIRTAFKLVFLPLLCPPADQLLVLPI